MRIGPPNFGMVSTDTAGVPCGGNFGDVAWFEDRLNRMGLYLGWTRIWDRFVIYSMRGPQIVCQMVCQHWDTMTPIPLNGELLSLVRIMWEGHCRNTYDTMQQWLQQQERDYHHRLEVERKQLELDMEGDVMRGVELDMDPSSRKLISVPACPAINPLSKKELRKMAKDWN